MNSLKNLEKNIFTLGDLVENFENSQKTKDSTCKVIIYFIIFYFISLCTITII